MKIYIKKTEYLEAELRRLHTLNQELIEALKKIGESDLSGADITSCGYMSHSFVYIAKSALVKATGEQA